MIRLQKYIADAGITSRRKAEQLILEGLVEVNGETILELGTKVSVGDDIVTVHGEVIDIDAVERHYILMHKPRGYMTTVFDPEGRKTVIDLLPRSMGRVYPVGRLDYLSEGLLILTNDGEVANNIIHPSANINKVYEVKVFGAVNNALLKALREGFQDPEVGAIKPNAVRVIKQLPSKTWLEVRIGDGKNREIRRLCEGHGLTIDKLKRVSIGALSIDGIGPGSYHFVTKKELLSRIGIDGKGKDKAAPKEYWSNRKTIRLDKKFAQKCPTANERSYLRFRKENYFDTIKQQEEKKRDLELAKVREREEEVLEYERKRAKRKSRLNKKRAQKEVGVHAVILK